jgi:exopolyphosphatase/guanosine-5'-triphosphate,3'-diphosphate pyrophosphatase
VTRRFFPDGKLTRDKWRAGIIAVRAELQELQTRYRHAGWDRAFGSSGTLRAVASICQAAGWAEKHVTASAVEKLTEALLERGDSSRLDLQGLSERRRPVIAGGVVILEACFRALGIEQMEVSPFALREGVLQNLLGRLENRDPRDKTVRAFASRFGVDRAQATQVKQAALNAFDQISEAGGLKRAHRELLAWSAELHETGLDISHSHYQRHSGYLVEESDMAGFSRQEQLFLATLVRFHRREVPANFAEPLPQRLHAPLRYALFCLRLAWILCRTRDHGGSPPFTLRLSDGLIEARFDPDWISARPLTATDLEQECTTLEAIGLRLRLSDH